MNSDHTNLAALLLSLVLVAPASANVGWTDAPLLKAERLKNGDRRSQSRFRPLNLESTRLFEFPPGKETSIANPLEDFGDGSYKIESRGIGNYHWVTAEDQNGLRFASTVKYFSNPGPAPREMLEQDKVKLEIRPLILPREHGRFRANEQWDFLVKLDGKPLANTEVNMQTSNGSNLRTMTSAQGIANLTFPDDFNTQPDPHAHHKGGHGGHRRPSAEFAVWIEHHGMTSAFNYKYSPDAFTNKVVLPAVGLLFAGSLITGFSLFRKRAGS